MEALGIILYLHTISKPLGGLAPLDVSGLIGGIGELRVA